MKNHLYQKFLNKNEPVKVQTSLYRYLKKKDFIWQQHKKKVARKNLDSVQPMISFIQISSLNVKFEIGSKNKLYSKYSLIKALLYAIIATRLTSRFVDNCRIQNRPPHSPTVIDVRPNHFDR